MIKKYTLTALILCLGVGVMAQVPNGSFELKEQAIYNKSLKEWRTKGLVYSVTDDNFGNGVKFPVDEPIVSAIISDLNTDDFDLAKGFQINARPDSLIVWMDFYIDADDTLIIRTKNRETQNPFGYGELRINGFQNGVKRFAIPITYTSPGLADSGVIQTYIKSGFTVATSSFTLYKMQFVNISGNPVSAIPNANFLEWNLDSIETPKMWTSFTYKSAIYGTFIPVQGEKIVADASQGNNAVQIKNMLDDGEYFSGGLYAISYQDFSAYNGYGDNPEPMFPVTKKYVKLTGDYKYAISSTDTAQVQVAMFYNDEIVALNTFLMTANQASYKQFSLNIDYDTFKGIPDYAAITIMSGSEDYAKMGSTLTIDNLAFAEASAIEKTLPDFVKIYPNPASNSLSIQTSQGTVKSITIVNLQGQVVLEIENITDNISLSTLKAGAYLVQLDIDGIIYTQKIIKQ